MLMPLTFDDFAQTISPTVTHWQGYTTFAILAGIGLFLLILAFKAARLVLILFALVLIGSSWPARNFVQQRVQSEVQKQLDKYNKASVEGGSP